MNDKINLPKKNSAFRNSSKNITTLSHTSKNSKKAESNINSKFKLNYFIKQIPSQ
jgi:hypothetical protein